MTSVIPKIDPRRHRWSAMQVLERDSDVADMARGHERLLERARRTTCHCSESVLNLGLAVALQRACVAGFLKEHPLLDQGVLEELNGERDRLAEDLDLLESLHESSPEASDTHTLATALVSRVQRLLEREQRVLYQPVLRLASEQESKP